jgi:rhodanese-related sulfurtransferase
MFKGFTHLEYPMSLHTITPEHAKRLLDEGAMLVDIREADEHARMRIPGARHHALSTLDQAALPTREGKPVIFHCRSGARTLAHAERLGATTNQCEGFIVEGGLEA